MRKLLPLRNLEYIKPFDCGDPDLNEFLYVDAIRYEKEYLSRTYVLEEDDRTIAYVSLLADKISRSLIPRSVWEDLNIKIPEEKHFNSYPSVKIGRLAVDKDYRHQNVGTKLVSLVASLVLSDSEYVAFRFITVDAYTTAKGFYERNEFISLLKEERPDRRTIPMYLDLKSYM